MLRNGVPLIAMYDVHMEKNTSIFITHLEIDLE